MKKQDVIGVVIAAALFVIGGGGWWWYSHSYLGRAGAPGPQTGTTVNTNPNGPDYSPRGAARAGEPGLGSIDAGSEYVADNLLLGKDSNAKLGTYLIGFNGMTLYTYAKDSGGVSNCTGQCAANWPPYLIKDTKALANLEAGVNGKAGTITRADGTMQVTYNGKPLYFYKGDTTSGDTNGEGIGNVWFVIAP